MAAWPSTLPDWQMPLSLKADPGFIRTKMDAGPVKQRRRYSAVAVPFQTQLQIDGTQFADLETFFHTTLSEGSLTFDRTDPTTDVTESFRFTDTPNYQLIAGGSTPAERVYQVTLNLEKMP